ncbi:MULTISPECIES: YlbL family protein [unclassified Candidatus Frackibacter]|uniref:YlbL family protein n=1 Tax=unclassified Candidatus Frackibacter TaxID=2648818 RepID=UPI00088CE87A|nr:MULTISPECIES: PDZ domain-containing protein [unclassified Candidatus Frackibacter]SDC48027.1 PDZ domain-containing protein [Candidatus Frackibacter sp. WG11]SEM95377.1 PDZ domain-containing protein [Candidatus Frackibacter sp. WG12]SFL73216.1 PDZ domain-containing protein [Candidatus Frackibacter sp. WG13]
MARFRVIRLKKIMTIILIIFVVVTLAAIWPTDYYIEAPGIAKELGPLVTVEDGHQDRIKGKFRLTAVSLEPASVLEYYYVSLTKPKGLALTPLKQQLPSGVDPKEYFEMMKEVMKESQLKAKAVALKQAGYDPKITGEGAKIVQVLEKSNAKGKLKKGDIITKIDGEPVELLTEVVSKIRDREVGDWVEVVVKRGEETKEYKIKTKEIEESPGKPSLGVLISSYKRSYEFPVDIEIDSGDIGGPSAGMMFTLEILNHLTEEDLTHGKDVAGTGTIALDGKVGEISGVSQKVLAAEKEGVDIFLAPKNNYQRAKETATQLKVVSVENIEDAINFLNSLE